jgi:hypothetical protein
MHRSLAVVGIVAVLAVSAACSSNDTKVSTTPTPTPTASLTGREGVGPPATTNSPPPSTATPPAAPSAPARVGDTLDLAGTDNGERMAVTLVKVVDPAKAANEFSSPSPGTRFVAVQLRLKNTGTGPYNDSPSNGARLIDGEGQQYQASVEDTSAGPGLGGSVTLIPGDTALGFITFELPAGVTPAKFQFALDSGFSDNVGQWLLG